MVGGEGWPRACALAPQVWPRGLSRAEIVPSPVIASLRAGRPDAHIRVLCDACRTASAEVCGKRDLPVMARVAAIRKFKAVGWHHDPVRHASVRAERDSEATGSGRWYCPTWARRTHM